MSRYWVLKTRDDGDIDPATREFREHWRDFQVERVVAIGWEPSLGLRRRSHSLESITSEEWVEDLVTYTYTDRADEDRVARARTACSKIRKFVNEMSAGDGVFLCQGYAGNRDRDVRVYGFAKIREPAYYDAHSTWWHIKRQACIWAVEHEVPVVSLRETLKKSSLTHAVHEISETSFHQVCSLLDFSYTATNG